jgi:hypothetical protein
MSTHIRQINAARVFDLLFQHHAHATPDQLRELERLYNKTQGSTHVRKENAGLISKPITHTTPLNPTDLETLARLESELATPKKRKV